MSVVTSGNLSVKVQGVLKQRQLSGKWGVLYDGAGKTNRPPRIELFEEKDSGSPVHTIHLEHLKFSDKSFRQKENFFLLSIKKEKHHFQLENVEDKEDWIQSLCHVSEDLWQQRASFRESSEIESESAADMSENILYESCDEVQQFKVSIKPTKGSEANNLKGHYMLNPSRDGLRLLEIGSIKSLHDWPYNQIRKYGSTHKIFKMEVGRTCTTGAAEFEFFTPEGVRVAELIAMYTWEMYNRAHKRLEASVSAPAGGDFVKSQTFRQMSESAMAHQAPSAAAPQRLSESLKESHTRDSVVSRSSHGGSGSSLDSKRDVPIPAPRSTVNKSKKENESANGVSQAAHPAGDTKISEKSSSVIVPPGSLQNQDGYSKENALPSQDPPAQVEDDPVSDTTESSAGVHDSSESIKHKKKSDKERKKLEKEQKAAEAKLKKQQEKEQKEREKELKEQREREAKEEKERLKRLKKESKAHEKLKSKKSLDTPAPATRHMSEGHIYDEPGELLQQDRPAMAVTAESDYCEADDFVFVASTVPKPAITPAAAESDVYAMPQKPKDRWKTCARPESDHIHQEDYLAIKQASLSESQQPPVPPYPKFRQSFPGKDTVESDYSHVGEFTVSSPAPENIYGMASATDTLKPNPPSLSTVDVESEYSEVDTVRAGIRD
ncbi:uncharacterized protein LOC143276445 [Babylonia areolata]|uniref:uncharacterized protein LOC143276445 n=1 Tax=Babylonia areolata TaxID=304850 RepID=UPI003FD16190